MWIAWFILFLVSPVGAWITCESGAVCPDHNLCCGNACLSGTRDSAAHSTCCGENSSTGCGEGFACAANNTCEATDPDFDDLPAFVPRYRLCSVTEEMTNVHGLFMPQSNRRDQNNSFVAAYLSNMGPLDTASEQLQSVTTAIILIHGSLRNPDDYLCCATAAIPENISSDNVLLLAPWFLAPEDGDVNVTTSSASGFFSPLRWKATGVHVEHTWRYGADALNADALHATNISSYDVVDRMIEILSSSKALSRLQTIVVAGHSAGGQFAQRYGLLSNTIMENANVHIRIVAANPKSYAYLDARRWMKDGSFRVPTSAEIDHCPNYNQWLWGWEDGVDAPYKDRAIQQAGGIDAVIARYPNRDVIYLSGEQDIIPNGHCEAVFQGPNRLTRSERYYAALQEICGGPPSFNHRRWVVANVHHDHCLMFQSVQGQHALFGTSKDGVDERSSNHTLRGREHHHMKVVSTSRH